MSRLMNLFREGGFPVALEITPPRKPREHVLLRRARRISRVAAVNVIQRPDRLPSVEASGILLEEGFEPVWHLANRGRSAAEINREIARARELGLRLALCVRGDHQTPDAADTPRIRDVVEWILRRTPSALVGVTADQAFPPERVLRNLLPKLAAGARFVETQPVFALAPFLALAEEVKSRVTGVRVLPMLMPLLSVDAARRLEARVGLRLPPERFERLAKGGSAYGWAMFRETLAALHESPLADGVAVMTLDLDPDDDFAAHLETALRDVLGHVPNDENSSNMAVRNASYAGLL